MMTTRVPASGADAFDGGAPAPGARARAIVGPLCWLAIIGCTIAVALLGASLFAVGLGRALNATDDIGEQVSIFWGLAAVAAVLAVTAIAAGIGRRWAAFVVALLLEAVTGLLAWGLYRAVVAMIPPAAREWVATLLVAGVSV